MWVSYGVSDGGDVRGKGGCLNILKFTQKFTNWYFEKKFKQKLSKHIKKKKKILKIKKKLWTLWLHHSHNAAPLSNLALTQINWLSDWIGSLISQ